jgi:chemotaxis-related protein WspB
MLFLTFRIGNDRYALATQDVVEVLPLINLKTIPCAANGVAGVINYHGRPVPLIDVTEMTLGQPSVARMSTRVILVNYVRESGESLLLGLKAEHVTETIRRTDADFVSSGVTVSGAVYLGPVTMEASQIIQRVDVRRIMTEDALAQLSRDVLDQDRIKGNA